MLSMMAHFLPIYCDPKSFEAVKQAISSMGLKVEKAEVEWVAKNT